MQNSGVHSVHKRATAPEKRQSKDPQTRDEWQRVVDLAELYLALQSCQMYGLIEGGPKINAERCAELLERGRKLGIRPRPLEQLAAEYLRPA